MRIIIFVIISIYVVITLKKKYDWNSHITAIKSRFSTPEIHKCLLNDIPRMKTYYDALVNTDNVKDKSVLDVGCGSGVLGSFAVKAGARRVIGVDVVDVKKVPGVNSIEFKIGTPIQQLKLDEKFDVIVSEWMGWMLYEENSIDMFLHARDKYLKPGGSIMPNAGSIHVCGFKGDYGIPGYKTVEFVPLEDMVTNDHQIHSADFYSLKIQDTFFITSDVTIESRNNNSIIDGIVIWFQVEFASNNTSLNTKNPTSWFQTVLRFKTPCEPKDVKHIQLQRTRSLWYKVWVNNILFNEGEFNMDCFEMTKNLFSKNTNKFHRDISKNII